MVRIPEFFNVAGHTVICGYEPARNMPGNQTEIRHDRPVRALSPGMAGRAIRSAGPFKIIVMSMAGKTIASRRGMVGIDKAIISITGSFGMAHLTGSIKGSTAESLYSVAGTHIG